MLDIYFSIAMVQVWNNSQEWFAFLVLLPQRVRFRSDLERVTEIVSRLASLYLFLNPVRKREGQGGELEDRRFRFWLDYAIKHVVNEGNISSMFRVERHE